MGRLERLKERKPVAQPIQRPTAEQVQEHIEAGGWQQHYSPVLRECVWFIRDEPSRAIFSRKHPDAIAYTLAELQELVKRCCGSAELRAVHEIKKSISGSIVSSSNNKFN